MKEISKHTLYRICQIYQVLEEMSMRHVQKISSKELANILGFSADSIRKDINSLGNLGNFGAKYDIAALMNFISGRLDMSAKKKVCIVGIGRMGSAIFNYELLLGSNYEIVAGFDSNINKIETMTSNIPLYPAFRIPEVVMEKHIELGVITVPSKDAQSTAERLEKGGIKGIVNMTGSPITVGENIYVTNIDVLKELRYLSSLIGLNNI